MGVEKKIYTTWSFFWDLPVWFTIPVLICIILLLIAFILYIFWINNPEKIPNQEKTIKKENNNIEENTQPDSIRLYKELPNQDNEFTKQFKKMKITPLNATFYFKEYYFKTEYFPSIIVTSDDLNETNGDTYGSILKAYLLCTLGFIAPSRYLSTNTLRLSDSYRKVEINKKQAVSVPDWIISKHKKVFPLHIIRQYDCNTNDIELFLVPVIHKKHGDYSFLRQSFDDICRELVGKTLTL